jgi:hypothetical protein
MYTLEKHKVTKRVSDTAGASAHPKKQRKLLKDLDDLDFTDRESNGSDLYDPDPDQAEDTSDVNDRDWIMEPDRWVFEDEHEDANEFDFGTSNSGIDEVCYTPELLVCCSNTVPTAMPLAH